MARGSLAKQKITEKLINLFGDSYIGTQNNKLYILEDDGGEKLQIAITLTCPKEGIEIKKQQSELAETNSNPNLRSVTISDSERKEVEDIMERLGL